MEASPTDPVDRSRSASAADGRERVLRIVGAFVHALGGETPRLHLLIPGAAPRVDDFAFEQRGPLFVAERDGVVLPYWEAPDDDTGQGLVAIAMLDGTTRLLQRARAARPETVTRLFPERQVVAVRVGAYEEPLQGPGWIEGLALTVSRARAVLARHLPGWDLVAGDVGDGGPVVEP